MTEVPSAESRLCTSCGLCCTGALHDEATLNWDEIEPAAAIGLPVRQGTTQPSFALPCPKLEGATCTIYGVRPRVCARYACRLLEQVREGRTLQSALPVVAEARRLAAELAEALPPGTLFPAARAALEAGTGPAPVQLRSFAFNHFLDRHFRNRAEGNILQSESRS
jgi:Fe-S-cluster containining protein